MYNVSWLMFMSFIVIERKKCHCHKCVLFYKMLDFKAAMFYADAKMHIYAGL